jgi:hypothetical protein
MNIRTSRKPRHTQADIHRALRDMQRLYRPKARDRAEARLRSAKDMMTAATVAVLAKDPGAEDLGNRALTALRAAQQDIEVTGAEA